MSVIYEVNSKLVTMVIKIRESNRNLYINETEKNASLILKGI